MNKAIEKIAALGVPGLIFLVAVSATGLSGAAAITAALAALGPGGMVGGIVFLGVTGLVTESLTKYGFEAIFKAVVKELYKRGESVESIKAKVNKYPVTKTLKEKLFNHLDKIENTERVAAE
ncbi:MAG: hypothetical protein IJR70_04800 [Eubacterium sp.]|nr:hypothetical protein [Eubacterium sp.]